MLAVALDAEERSVFRWIAMIHGKDGVKNFKWSSPDHAGTRVIPDINSPEVKRIIKEGQFLAAKSGASPEQFMAITGRKILFKLPDGSIVDGAGSPVTRHEEWDIIVPRR